MRTIDFIRETLSHFVKESDGPPPGVPATVDSNFEREVTAFCERHGISPIVYASLERLALSPQLSRITVERLKAPAGRAAARNDELLGLADRVAERLDAEAIPYRIMSDVALAETCYPRAALRPIDKIDMLVREGDLRRVMDASRALGFRHPAGDPPFHSEREALSYFQYVAPCVLSDETGRRIHYQFRLFDYGEPERDEPAWRRGTKWLAPEDQLMHSCLAYNMSYFDKLLHAVDIGRLLVRNDGLDWRYIEARLKERGFYSAFYYTLDHTRRCLKLDRMAADLPDPGRMRRKLFDVYWQPVHNSFSVGGNKRPHPLRFYLFEGRRVRDKLRLIRRLLAPRTEWVSAFFGRPYSPWLKLKFIVLTFRSRIGVRLT